MTQHPLGSRPDADSIRSTAMGQPVPPFQNLQMMTELLKEGSTDDMYYKIMDFWDDPELVQWFHSHGYTLYNRVLEEGNPASSTVPALPCDEIAVANYPYAHHDARKFWSQSIPLRAHDQSVRLFIYNASSIHDTFC
jgi:hypothetical protein